MSKMMEVLMIIQFCLAFRRLQLLVLSAVLRQSWLPYFLCGNEAAINAVTFKDGLS